MTVWGKLDARRRAVVIGATLLMFLAIALLARGPGNGQMALLYAGLDPAAAGEVVAALEARGTPYEVRGDAIWVPKSARDLERMTLAAEGLPTTSTGGYELLDSLSGFGTTSQMFDAAYWRAKEGELARTILAVPAVRAARVHISAGSSRPFQRQEEPSAAVTVTTRSGSLDASQAQALRHLVAAAVPGMSPDDVAVIDAESGLVAGEDPEDATASRAEELAGRAERLLEARVGAGNAVVEVSVDTVTETERLTERNFDPEGRVAISSETEESESTASSNGGAVTVASNLPDGEAQGSAGEGSSEESSRTLTNYEVSETSREVLREPGAVRRLTVAVLVNDLSATDEAGVVTTVPRPEEELAALQELVASAVGYDEARGDVITVKSLPFQPLAALGSEAAPPTGLPFDLMGLLRPALLALVAVVLGLFVLRPLLREQAGPDLLPEPPALAAPEGGFPSALPVMDFSNAMAPVFNGGTGLLSDGAAADPAERLRRLIAERQEETAQILQSWIDDAPGQPAGKAASDWERS